eukprot:8229792-Pyramimonas_sp.AAC.1
MIRTCTRGGLMQRDLWRDHEIVAQLRPAKLQTSTPSARSSSRVTMNSNHDSNIRRVSSLGSKWYHLAHARLLGNRWILRSEGSFKRGFSPSGGVVRDRVGVCAQSTLSYHVVQRFIFDCVKLRPAQARRTFQQCVAGYPEFCRVWVSYAQ